jgi:hypothetical protein
VEERRIIPSRTGWRARMAAGPMLAALSISGCASFWDDVTSRDFKFKTLFVAPDPMVVLQTSNDGDHRAKALGALKEPILHGGTQADQDEAIKILTAAAVSDKQPICRLQAMQTLGRFKDPRAATALTDAFYRANSFAPETSAMLQCHALKSLGETASPAGIELLTRVVREPRSEGTEVERQNAMDIRLAAARALGHFRDPQSEAALFVVMRTEKDVGLRMCAYEALKISTGKKMPLESKDWESLPQLANVTLPAAPSSAPSAVAEAKTQPTVTPVGASGTLAPAAPQAVIPPGGIQPISTAPSTGTPSSPVIVPSSLSTKP